MKQDDWTQALHSRLNDHKAAVPDDLWSKIEERLDGSGTAGVKTTDDVTADRRRRGTTVRLSVWAAAAAAAIALLVTLGYQANENTIRQLASNSRQDDGSMATKSQYCTTTANGKMSSTPMLAEIQTTIAHNIIRNSDTMTNGNGTNCEVETTDASDTTAELAPSSDANAATNASSYSAEPKKTLTAHKHADPAYAAGHAYYAETHAKNAAETRWNVGAHTSGTFNSSRSQNFPAMRAASQHLTAKIPINSETTADNNEQYGYLAATDMVLCAKYNEVKHHAQPVSVGISVGYALNGRLSLTSGIVYTRTSSDFIRSVGSDEVVTSQKRHYIGVPFGLKCRVWGNDRAHVYATAGAQADFNVAAKQTEGDIETTADKDRVQLSASAAAGIQLNIMPKIGLYAEPGVKHYFDNHSSVETVFKEKPWAFSLQLGLRVDL